MVLEFSSIIVNFTNALTRSRYFWNSIILRLVYARIRNERYKESDAQEPQQLTIITTMFGHPPTYRNLPHFSYDPRLQSSYYSNVPVQNPWSVAQEQAVTERASAMAEQRARRAQYLPDEDVDSEDEWEYNQFGPRERAYLDARKRQDILRKRFMEEEAVRQRALEEKRWQDSLDRRKQEDEVKRRQIIERRKLQREEEEEATANKRVRLCFSLI